MRKVIVALVGIALMGMAASSFAASDWQSVNMTMTISEDTSGIIITVPPANWGGIAIAQDLFSNDPSGQPRCSVQNVGAAVVDMEVGVTAINSTNPVALGAAPGVDTIALSAVFTMWGSAWDVGSDPLCRDMVAGDFGAEDTFAAVGTYIAASATDLASTLGAPDTVALWGYNMVTNDERSLRFRLQTPTLLTAIPNNIL
jgi:hypothetical protein